MNAEAQTSRTVAEITERYYDSDDADLFYSRIWGGEDIHVGIYGSGERDIRLASRRTVERMADALEPLETDAVVADLGAGYGGSARYLAKRFGCRVRCLNLSLAQNRRNAELTRLEGLADRVEVVHANFEEIPLAKASVQVVWSQDAFLHSARRSMALVEACRILQPGGRLIFTDPMQTEGCSREVLRPVLDRIHLESLGSVAFYRASARALGLREVGFEDLTPHLVLHYDAVRTALQARYDEMVRSVSRPYMDRMLAGLGHWIDAGVLGHLTWGIFHFEAPPE